MKCVVQHRLGTRQKIDQVPDLHAAPGGRQYSSGRRILSAPMRIIATPAHCALYYLPAGQNPPMATCTGSSRAEHYATSCSAVVPDHVGGVTSLCSRTTMVNVRSVLEVIRGPNSPGTGARCLTATRVKRPEYWRFGSDNASPGSEVKRAVSPVTRLRKVSLSVCVARRPLFSSLALAVLPPLCNRGVTGFSLKLSGPPERAVLLNARNERTPAYIRLPRWTLFSVSKQMGSPYCFEIVINFGFSSFSAWNIGSVGRHIPLWSAW
jgi:hypothetical protein